MLIKRRLWWFFKDVGRLPFDNQSLATFVTSDLLNHERVSRDLSFFNWANHGLFCLFSVFPNTNFTEKTIGFSGIRTRIVRVEGEHADHLTTTTTALLGQHFASIWIVDVVLWSSQSPPKVEVPVLHLVTSG